MKLNLIIFALLIMLISCNTSRKKEKENSGLVRTSKVDPNDNSIKVNSIVDSMGYKLMVQKCYICHFEKPTPTKRNEMIAPPMLRVQEHYKSTFTNKEEFINAVISFTNNPSKEKTLMPGAVKKFKLMPKLFYDDKELLLIAETMYDYDFGSAPKMRMQMMSRNGVQLNHGEKWKLKPESVQLMEAITKKVNHFSSDNIADYNQLSKDVFNEVKKIMLDDAYTGEKFNQIHLFFYGIEDHMHLLMSLQSIDEARNQFYELKKKLNTFNAYFE